MISLFSALYLCMNPKWSRKKKRLAERDTVGAFITHKQSGRTQPAQMDQPNYESRGRCVKIMHNLITHTHR